MTKPLDPFDAIHAKLDQILSDLNKPAEPNHPGGLKPRLTEQERWRAEHEKEHVAGFSLKVAGGMALVSATLGAAMAKVADALTRGTTPPGHP